MTLDEVIILREDLSNEDFIKRLKQEKKVLLFKSYGNELAVSPYHQMPELYVKFALSTRASLFRVLIRKIREEEEKEKSKQEEEKPVEIPRFDMSDSKYFYGPLNRDLLEKIRTSKIPDFFDSPTAKKYNLSYGDYCDFSKFILETYRDYQKKKLV